MPRKKPDLPEADVTAFYTTIRQDPDADTPRYIFADWLEERGQMEWAAHIRRNISLVRLPKSDPAYWTAQTEQGRYETTYGNIKRFGPTFPKFVFNNRGLPTTIDASWITFTKKLKEIEQSPLPLCELRLDGLSGSSKKFTGATNWPVFSLFRNLAFRLNTKGHFGKEISELKHLRDVQSLGFEGLSDRLAASILQHPAFANLQRFGISVQKTSEIHFRNFCNALPNSLRKLSLGLREDSINSLFLEGRFDHLEDLDLIGTQCNEILQTLATGVCPQLRRIRMDSYKPGNQLNAGEFLQNRFRDLENLELRTINVFPKFWDRLDVGNADGGMHMNYYSTNTPSDIAFARSPALKRLESLTVFFGNGAFLSALAENPHAKRLRFLSLVIYSIADWNEYRNDLQRLLNSPHLCNLQAFEFSPMISDAEAELILNSSFAPSLLRLKVNLRSVSESVSQRFFDATIFPKLISFCAEFPQRHGTDWDYWYRTTNARFGHRGYFEAGNLFE